MQQVLLTTTGRKSGKPHTVPLGAVREGDGWIVIAIVNDGAEVHPGWWLNMVANPNVTLQVNDEVIKARNARDHKPGRSGEDLEHRGRQRKKLRELRQEDAAPHPARLAPPRLAGATSRRVLLRAGLSFSFPSSACAGG